MFADSNEIFQRVFEQAIGTSESADTSNTTTEDLIADLIGRYVGPMLGSGQLGPLLGYVETALSHYSELRHRDAVLAAALGACECWGESGDCEICDGAGFPGWSLPDEDLFAEWVRPALTALARHRSRGHGALPRLAPVIESEEKRGE